MQSLTAAERDRIDGLAAFAATAFVIGAVVIGALERVGAPDGFVESLGPMFAFFAVSVIGIANRAASLTDFLAARRAIPAFYAALGFAAIVGGVALAFVASGRPADELPWLPLAAGAAVAGLVTAPTIRAANVSSAIDVLASRFPALSTRLAFGLILFVCGVLTASAGFQLVAQSLAAALGGNPVAGVVFASCALAFTLVPGGVKSVAWTDAASGGGALMIVAFGAAFGIVTMPAPLAPVSEGLAALAARAETLRADPQLSLAFAAAFAFYFPLLAPGMATPTAGEARRAGFAGFLLAVFGLAAALVALPMFSAAPRNMQHTGQALLTAAAWLPSLALARSGALAASRSFGVDLARAYSRLTVLSSRRIAVGRLVMLLAIGLCPAVTLRLGLSTERALTFALSATLAFLAPSILLALVLPARASSVSAFVALIAAAGAAVAQAWPNPAAFSGFGVLSDSLFTGSVAFAAGAVAALVAPARKGRRYLPKADPFVDMPFDPIDIG